MDPVLAWVSEISIDFFSDGLYWKPANFRSCAFDPSSPSGPLGAASASSTTTVAQEAQGTFWTCQPTRTSPGTRIEK